MTAPTTAIDYPHLFIGGQWRPPSTDETITVVSPTTGEPIFRVAAASTQDLDDAVSAARRAFDDPTGWSHWPTERRADALERLAALMTANADSLATAVTTENGMPISTARATEGAFPAALLSMYAAMIRTQAGEEERQGLLGGRILVRQEPIGVVAAITPWNFPQSLLWFKLAPALAAGCTIVVKPAPETPIDALVMADLFTQAGIPAGVLSILPGGPELGAQLVEHPGIDKVAFTGSTRAGRAIGEACGRLLRPVTLELGGKSAAIVLEDADLTANLEAFFTATLLNSGQTCFLGTRILAPRTRYQQVVDTLTDMARAAVVGDPMDPATAIGPLVSRRQRERVESYIAAGRAEGGRITTGGGRPPGFESGWFVEPTIFSDVPPSATIAREEIFGPVLTVLAYDGIDDAVAIANDSNYGLAGSVWSADREAALGVARRVRTGTIGINHYLPDPAAPFGGIKASGLGRELGPEGLSSYQVSKSIYLTA